MWWFFTSGKRNLTLRRLFLCLIGATVLILLPADVLVDYFFDTTIGNEYIRPVWESILGLSTLGLLVAGLFNPPLVAIYDEYKPDIYRNGYKVNNWFSLRCFIKPSIF